MRAALKLVQHLPPLYCNPADKPDVFHACQVKDFLYCMALNNSVFPKPKVSGPCVAWVRSVSSI